MQSISVTPGTGQATVSWLDTGDPGILMYRLAAEPQGYTTIIGSAPRSATPSTPVTAAPLIVQSSPRWQSIAATHSCRTVTATVTGLTSTMSYDFWLDAVHTTTAYGVPAATQETMIGRSGVVTIR